MVVGYCVRGWCGTNSLLGGAYYTTHTVFSVQGAFAIKGCALLQSLQKAFSFAHCFCNVVRKETANGCKIVFLFTTKKTYSETVQMFQHGT